MSVTHILSPSKPWRLEFWWLCDQPDGRSSAARNSTHNTSGAVEQWAPNQHSPEIARQRQFDFEDATSWKAPCSLYFSVILNERGGKRTWVNLGQPGLRGHHLETGWVGWVFLFELPGGLMMILGQNVPNLQVSSWTQNFWRKIWI